MKKYLSPNDAAKFLMVSPITLRTWANKGIIKAATTAGGHRRYDLETLKKFALENGIEFSDAEVRKEKILIVDDEDSFASMLSEYLNLKLENIETAIATSGFKAGQMVSSFDPTIMLLDMNMPDINGCEVCQSVKNNPETNHVRVITMTGMYSDKSVERAMECGAEACIQKPIDIENLINIINHKSFAL